MDRVKRISKICDLVYEIDDRIIEFFIGHPQYSLIKFDKSPIGSIAVKREDKHEIYIVFRGTAPITPSSYLVDVAVGVAQQPESFKTASELTAIYFGGDEKLIEVGYRILLPQISSQSPVDPSQTSREILSAYVFRAIMFTYQIMSDVKNKDCKIIVGGHSLGGIYAQVVAKYFNLPLITFASPGVKSIYEKVIEGVDMYCPPATTTRGYIRFNFYCDGDPIPSCGQFLGNPIQCTMDTTTNPEYQKRFREAHQNALVKVRKEIKSFIVTGLRDLPTYIREDANEATLNEAHSILSQAQNELNANTWIHVSVDAFFDTVGSFLLGQPSAYKVMVEKTESAKQTYQSLWHSINCKKQLEDILLMKTALTNLRFFEKDFDFATPWSTITPALQSFASHFSQKYNEELAERKVLFSTQHSIKGIVASIPAEVFN